MIRTAGQATENEVWSTAAGELHLCNNLRHLMLALTDIQGRTAQARIVYLEDDAPLSIAFKKRLQATYPHIVIHYTTDAAQIAAFGGGRMTGVFSRNIRIDPRRGFVRATQWTLPILAGQWFGTGYIYHPGLFTAKPASFSCDHVVMRESGLNNYVAFKVPFAKALIRALCGRVPFRQVWGEEHWVDVIEVSWPDHLPPAVRSKGRQLTFAQLLDRLDPRQTAELGQVFVPLPPVIEEKSAHRAVLLTQPLDTVGLCSTQEKHELYQWIVNILEAQGYKIHVKYHLTEQPYPLKNCAAFDVNFPVELWTALGLPRFDLAVALCSASLTEGETLVATKVVQLLTPATFNAIGLTQWRAALPAALTD